MKHLFGILGLVILASPVIISCEDESITGENDNKITVQFDTSQMEIEENGGESGVILHFSKPVLADAIISLKAGAGYEGVLNTVPPIENGSIKLEVRKGDHSAAIAFHPIDNNGKTGDKILDLGLLNLPGPFVAGMKKSLVITVNDDETAQSQSVANFIEQEVSLQETNTAGVEYQIHLSEALDTNAEISISLSSEKGTYDLHFVTEPAAENNNLTLPVRAGEKVVGFKVKPVNDQEITGDLKINFSISHTSEAIRKGETLQQTLTIIDEELAGKPKGYEVTAADQTLKKFYEYDAKGRISKVNWESYTPYYTHGTDTYFYDEAGRLVKINKHPFKDIVYHWSNGRIIRSDEVSENVIREYSEYDYDEAGNVAGVVSYHLRASGEFAKGMFTVYLYFLDGNLYKSLTYNGSGDPEAPHLVRTRTYEHYIDVSNPFPMAEIIPGIRSQTKLATTYRVEEAGQDLTYELAYEYHADGRPAKRIATARGDIQTAVYHYY